MYRYLIMAGITLLGAAAGYAYYYFIGCAAGNTCAITSNPLYSTVYGALIGGVLSFNVPSKKVDAQDSTEQK